MSVRRTAAASGAALLLAACAPHRVQHAEGGLVDAATPRSDAFVPPGDDAFVPDVDAFVPPASDAGRDAFVPPASDAGHDAFAPPDAASGCTPLPTGAPLILHGTIGTSPTYTRPFDCSTPSTIGTAVGYHAYVLCNAGAARTYAFALDPEGTGGIADPFVVVYAGSGDVSSLACLTVDDDGGGMPSALATASVTGTITVVATTYDNADTGGYVLTITPM